MWSVEVKGVGVVGWRCVAGRGRVLGGEGMKVENEGMKWNEVVWLVEVGKGEGAGGAL